MMAYVEAQLAARVIPDSRSGPRGEACTPLSLAVMLNAAAAADATAVLVDDPANGSARRFKIPPMLTWRTAESMVTKVRKERAKRSGGAAFEAKVAKLKTKRAATYKKKVDDEAALLRLAQAADAAFSQGAPAQ
jgi:hypothetical protein